MQDHDSDHQLADDHVITAADDHVIAANNHVTAAAADDEDQGGQPEVGATEAPAANENETIQSARAPRAHFRDRSRGWSARPRAAGGGRRPASPAGTPLDAHAATDDVATGAAGARTNRARATTQGMRARRQRGLFAAILAVILLLFALSRILGTSTASAPPRPAAIPAATSIPFAAIAGAPITAKTVLGGGAKLKGPREAIQLPNGYIAVADTDNSRLAILDKGGSLVTSVQNGAAALAQPFALATQGNNLYVLDAVRGAIEQYDISGRFIREIIHDSALLQDARGMSIGKNGTIYAANPRSNAIVVLSPYGKLITQMTSPLGSGPAQYNQPSDIAVAPDSSLYIYDDANARIKHENASGHFVMQWSAPQSDTIHSVHVLPLADGRLLASDPNGGALLVYPLHGGTPTRLPLRVAGQALGLIQPLGLARLSNGNILVTDGVGARLLVVTLP